jgi:transcriptional regulator with XRE-family HTH domain
VDLVRFGRGIRALRVRRRLRQKDLAAAANLSPTKIARIERGQGGSMPGRDLDRAAQALGATTDLRLNWNGEALDRLLDGAHARIVDVVAAQLRGLGWEVVLEATFFIRGERGSIDILAWHAASRVVLVIEVKSVVPDIQAMLSSLDRKWRLAIEIARGRGWTPVAVGRLLVVADSRTSRRRVEALSSTFAAEFPQRAIAVRRWLASPTPTAPL